MEIRADEQMNHFFVHFPTEEGTVVINLNQIVKITVPKGKEDEITLHMSDQSAHTFHGEELVLRIVMLTRQFAIDLHGQILTLANFDHELAELKNKKQEASANNTSQTSNR